MSKLTEIQKALREVKFDAVASSDEGDRFLADIMLDLTEVVEETDAKITNHILHHVGLATGSVLPDGLAEPEPGGSPREPGAGRAAKDHERAEGDQAEPRKRIGPMQLSRLMTLVFRSRARLQGLSLEHYGSPAAVEGLADIYRELGEVETTLRESLAAHNEAADAGPDVPERHEQSEEPENPEHKQGFLDQYSAMDTDQIRSHCGAFGLSDEDAAGKARRELLDWLYKATLSGAKAEG